MQGYFLNNDQINITINYYEITNTPIAPMGPPESSKHME